MRGFIAMVLVLVVALVVLVLALGCGRVGFDTAARDAGEGATDAAADGPTGAFQPPVLVAPLADPAADDDPTLPDDMLEIYFQSARAGQADIWRATRASVADPWSPPTRVLELSSNAADDHPGISRDGLAIYFTSARGGGGRQIWSSTRADRAAPWAVPVAVPALSIAGADSAEPDLARSGTRIALGRGATFARDLYEATRASVADAWDPPQPLASLNDGTHQSSPFYASDRELWFGAIRPEGAGRVDLYRAERPSPDAPFAAPALIEGVNSTADDDDLWLSADGRTLIFSSDRSGDSELYQATR